MIEVRFVGRLLAPALGLHLVDEPGVEIGVDGHLLPGHGVEGEAGRHFGYAAGPGGDDHELDDDEDEEDDDDDVIIEDDDDEEEDEDDDDDEEEEVDDDEEEPTEVAGNPEEIVGEFRSFLDSIRPEDFSS